MTRRQLPQRELQNPDTPQHPDSKASEEVREATGVVIVANRLPVEQRPDGTLGRSPGGLASAVAGLLGLAPDAGTAVGPIGIASETGKVLQAPLVSQLIFVGILSVNLAVLNVLPFPPLDGGRIAVVIIEASELGPTFRGVAGACLGCYTPGGFAALGADLIDTDLSNVGRFASPTFLFLPGRARCGCEPGLHRSLAPAER